jgi:pimeloyl-ACP methyl ester carboxylesterase
MWLDLAVGRREKLQEFSACAKETLEHGAGWALASAFQCYLPDTVNPLVPIDQPFLAIWGRADCSHRNTDRRSSLGFGPAGQFIEHPDLGHFPELEDPPRIYDNICQFTR